MIVKAGAAQPDLDATAAHVGPVSAAMVGIFAGRRCSGARFECLAFSEPQDAIDGVEVIEGHFHRTDSKVAL